jgi:hypothetical protein
MKAVFIGYESERKAYRCYNPIGKRITISRDVVFDEATTWHWCDTVGDQQATGEPFMVEYITKLVRDIIPATPMPKSPPAGEPAASATEVNDDDMDAKHDDAHLWLRPIDDVIRDATPPDLARRVFNIELNFSSSDEPTSFHEAEHEESWRQAMINEMKWIEDNDIWELTSLLEGH